MRNTTVTGVNRQLAVYWNQGQHSLRIIIC